MFLIFFAAAVSYEFQGAFPLFACANVENENETSKAKIIFNFHGVYRFL
jgi:hypothetical protein